MQSVFGSGADYRRIRETNGLNNEITLWMEVTPNKRLFQENFPYRDSNPGRLGESQVS